MPFPDLQGSIARVGKIDDLLGLKTLEFLGKKRPDARVTPIALTSRKNCLRAAHFYP